MPYPSGTAKIVIGGTIGGTEAFAFGYQVLLNGDPGQLNATKINGEASAALTGNFLTTAVKALFPSNVVFQSVRTYLYAGGTAAAYQAENTTINTPGSSAVTPLPFQCATVVSLETNLPGRSKRGRAYLPPLTTGVVTATGQMASATCTTLANAFAAMLTAMNADTDPDVAAVVASATHSSTQPITNVRVDSIIDTQRRRRNKLTPSSSISASV